MGSSGVVLKLTRPFRPWPQPMILDPSPPPKPTMSAAHNAATKDRVLIACIGDEVRFK